MCRQKKSKLETEDTDLTQRDAIRSPPSPAHLAEDPAALAVGLLHHAEDGEVPIVELAHQGLQVVHQQRLWGQDGFVLEGVQAR